MRHLPPLQPYDDAPWELSFEQRVKDFYAIVKQKKKVAVLLYRRMDTSTFRYRCYNVVQALQKSKQWGAVVFIEEEYPQVMSLLDNIDLLVLTRVKWTLNLEWLTEKAKMKGIPVLFDVDDRVFDLNVLKLLTNTLAVDLDHEVAYDFWFAEIARIQQAAALAEGFITTNAYLGKRLEEKFFHPYQIIVNSLNTEQISVSEKLCKEKSEKVNGRPFSIGYFSGTPSHINDFLEVAPEICAFLKKHSDVVLDVVGFMEFPPMMKSLIEQNRVRFTPLVDFIELQRLIAQVDVNIVPLVENSFTNCKSELKYFEAAVVDTVTIATPIYTYAHSIRNGENGFLCRPGEWFDCLEKIYLKKVDTGEICRKAHMDALQRYSGESFVKAIEDAYNAFM